MWRRDLWVVPISGRVGKSQTKRGRVPAEGDLGCGRNRGDHRVDLRTNGKWGATPMEKVAGGFEVICG